MCSAVRGVGGSPGVRAEGGWREKAVLQGPRAAADGHAGQPGDADAQLRVLRDLLHAHGSAHTMPVSQGTGGGGGGRGGDGGSTRAQTSCGRLSAFLCF